MRSRSRADATDIAATEAAIKKGAEKFGKFGQSCSPMPVLPAARHSAAPHWRRFEKVISTNVTAVFFTVQAALPYLNGRVPRSSSTAR